MGASAIITPQGNSASITLKGDVASSSSITDGSVHILSIGNASSVTAVGGTSNLPTVVTLNNPVGNPQTVASQ